MFFFFFQAEDGIRDVAVTGVQTCALPISRGDRERSAVHRCDELRQEVPRLRCAHRHYFVGSHAASGRKRNASGLRGERQTVRSEERRVGKECRSRWSAAHTKKKKNATEN